ncbi:MULTISPECIES: 4-(cytidine 5'-diphospho)-2-C-methyl-D-erythritol kinase [Roseomonadaceae]|uniref:4-diphosphocytidyl-2-C-methyl-D-erythritol kinase n=1 Tax=Falsiroseomonas oleicola TaxID=2801474 RepID=A0ABS6H3G7_9PROT|nr:4-(cytidine 5'-diphospho)-2-C-methyl-D-erythritol kinase [Roseomonas oleicola]MBU8542563.1 4-(cytidine 5'-diphospho)-2-C-methyl-D-erythritol kinase [Roseomonas oleicola]
MSRLDPGFAPAKVNLYLRVTGRRADGFHLLDSLAVFAGVGDRVSATPADTLALSLAGPEAGALAAEPDNLVLRAARALAQAAGVSRGAALRLEKNLPIASGIGGGSADAAAALRVLAALWGVSADLPAMAERLGADVPVCVTGQPARMQGVGEVLSPVPSLPPCGLLLANPRLPLATPAVFRARQGGFSPEASLPEAWADAADLADWLRPLGNDLQAAAITLCPPVAEVLAAIAARPGCLLARMSGSGATCFGLFATAAEAAGAAAALPAGWWRWGGALAT